MNSNQLDHPRSQAPHTSYPDLDSNQLIELWRSGDEQAAEELYSRYAQQVTSVIKHRVNRKFRTRFASEDLVQSVFKSAFRMTQESPQEFSNNQAFTKWLVTVALNKVFKRIQRESAQKRSPDREQSLDSSSSFTSFAMLRLASGPGPQETMEISELWEKISAVVNEKQRCLMELRWEGYSQKEIAERMGVDARTVRRWSRDLEKRAAKLLSAELAQA